MAVLLDTLLEITLYSGILFLVILVFKKIFHKHMSASLNYLVWMLLIVRLLTPVTIDSGLKLVVIPEDQTPVVQNEASISSSAMNINENLGNEAYIPQYQQHQSASSNATHLSDSETYPAVPVPHDVADWKTVAISIWAGGMALYFAYITMLHMRFRRIIKQSTVRAPSWVSDILEASKKELGIKANIRISIQSSMISPALTLSFHPALLMPEGMIRHMSHEQTELGIRHELTHFKRGDNIMNLLLMLLRGVYWFNPFVWAAYKLILVDMEAACDACVTARLEKEQRALYINTIIDLGSDHYMKYALGMGMPGGKRSIERRIRGMFMKKKSKPSARLATFLFIPLTLLICFTTACQPTPDNPFVIGKRSNSVEEAAKANNAENAQEIANDKKIIEEQIKKIDGHLQMKIIPNPKVTINVDADIVVPEYMQIPLVRVRPKNFSKEQFEAWATYLTNGQPLFYSENNDQEYLSNEELAAVLPRLKGYAVKDDLPSYLKDHLNRIINGLENDFGVANSKNDEKPYDGTLLQKEGNEYYNSITVLKCYLGKDTAAHLSLWQSLDGIKAQMTFDNSDYFSPYNTFEPYTGADAKRINVTYEEAKAKAEDFVHKVDGDDSNLSLCESSIGYQINTFANYTKETSPQAYAFRFARNYDGALVKPIDYLHDPNANVNYNRQIFPESFFVVIDDYGINTASWMNYTEEIETVSQDVPLKDFDTIREIFMQHCKQKFTWIPQDESLPSEISAILNVKRVELNIMAIPEKDNLQNYITIPVWDFIADMKYDKKYVAQDGYPAIEQQNMSILTISAMDGSIINREQGY